MNVLGICKQLYELLDSDNFKAYLEMAIMKYKNTQPSGRRPPTRGWLLEVLMAYEPVAKYVYTNEVERKRDRLAEAVIASKTKAREFDRGLGYWVQMTAHFADCVSDAATLKAFGDAGVKEVRWNTQRDGRVCLECEARNGLVYKIDNVPPKPHWGCRCYLTAVKTNKEKFKGNN